MNKYTKLVKNVVTFAVGNLGSKLIVFLMLPFYTTILSTKEYGQIDLFTTTLSLLLPLITLNLIESVFRYSMDKQYNKKSVFTSIVVTCGLLFMLTLFTYQLLGKEIFGGDYGYLFFCLLFLFILQSLFKQFVRALQKLRIYMYSDLVNTIIFVSLNFYLLGKLNLGVNGYLISMIVAYTVDCILLFVGARLYKYLAIGEFKPFLLRELIRYSTPLIPNALMWWVINISDRYIITYYMGYESNGVYSVATKFPSIIYMLYTVFNRGWQISAIEENDSESKSEFYSKIFTLVSQCLIIGSSIYILFNKFIIGLLVANEFAIAWEFTPLLVIGVVFSALSSFVGICYTTSKKTKGAFISSSIAAITNIILNLLLIPYMGIQGACLATAISFLVMFIIRILDSKKYVILKFNIIRFIASFVLLVVQLIFHLNEFEYSFVSELIMVIMIIILNHSFIRELSVFGKKIKYKFKVKYKNAL
ncbi:lipopolysaccharide biosynthesis protein [Mesobacillus foraminis]|uniref:lipopolysaccharide biosynthesis protein n=1 Tax=Mesobacillus foraminis TaxID=279826 RepID=UPI000EF4F49D|nr:polysaccharide biosynthesis C-terminal domain-containing protein [Mesobacillus foraminis]